MTGRRRTGKRVITHRPVQDADRRAAQRIPVQIMVQFSAKDNFHHVGHGVAIDLSETGCKLCSELVLPKGSFWDLYLTIPGATRPVLISEVQIVWAAEKEYGIEFLRVMARERTRLRHFIWKHINHSILRSGPPLFTLVDRSNPRHPHLKSLP